MRYVSLHGHSTYSFQDGYRDPAVHIARAAELDMWAYALTEHGNVSSHAPLEQAAIKAGIKPIFGLEAYFNPVKSMSKFHLTLMAMNTAGYSNLMRLCSRSWSDGFYRYPTVNLEMLRDCSEGLICLSGCADSWLSCSLDGGKSVQQDLTDGGKKNIYGGLWKWKRFEGPSYERALYTAAWFKDLFGDRFYLECQQFPELKRTQKLNPAWERIGKRLSIPLVATADVHTIAAGDQEVRAVLHASGRGSTVAETSASWDFDVPDYIPTSDRIMMERLIATGLTTRAAEEAFSNTGTIAERCKVTLPKAKRLRFPGTVKDLKW